jgi:hypothetical protein
MVNNSIFDLFQKMDSENIILAYKGEINSELLEAVYTMMDKHLEQKKISPDRKKKFYHILVEALQNVFHHQSRNANGNHPADKNDLTGFVVRCDDDHYRIITGNYIRNASIDHLKKRLDEVNDLTPEKLRVHYQQSLAGNEFSEKGGAGLGIIEMARKSGSKLNYEFTTIDKEYSFFSLAITIP